MERYLQLLEDIKALGMELMDMEDCHEEVEIMDMHIDCAIMAIKADM